MKRGNEKLIYLMKEMIVKYFTVRNWKNLLILINQLFLPITQQNLIPFIYNFKKKLLESGICKNSRIRNPRINPLFFGGFLEIIRIRPKIRRIANPSYNNLSLP